MNDERRRCEVGVDAAVGKDRVGVRRPARLVAEVGKGVRVFDVERLIEDERLGRAQVPEAGARREERDRDRTDCPDDALAHRVGGQGIPQPVGENAGLRVLGRLHDGVGVTADERVEVGLAGAAHPAMLTTDRCTAAVARPPARMGRDHPCRDPDREPR